MLTEAYMQRAFLAAILLAPLASLLGVFVTARRMAFFSDTIAHAALAGMALGVWLGLANPTFPIIVVSLFVAGSILWLKERTDLLTDTIMALVLSGAVAVAMTILSLHRTNVGDIHRVLFGDILAVSGQDLLLAAGLFLAVGFVVFWRLNALALITAHEDLAHVCGIRVRRLNHAFVLLLTLTVTLSIRLLGIILVTSLVVIPAASARNVSRNLRQQLLFSMGLGWLGALAGLGLAYRLDLPCGPSIVLTCIALFLVTLAAGRLRQEGPTL